MKKRKITCNISEDIAEMLEKRVPKRTRSAFIEAAVRARFAMEDEEKRMREAAMADRTRDAELELIDASLELADIILQNDDILSEEELSELEDLV